MDYDEAKDTASNIIKKWNLTNNNILLKDIATAILRAYKVGVYGIRDKHQARGREVKKRSGSSQQTNAKKS